VAKFKSLFAAAAAASLVASAALAQTIDETMTTLVAAWVDTEGVEFPDDIRAYGLQCMLPAALAMPDAAKQVIIREGGMEAGLTALQTEGLEALNAFAPTIQECVETMFLGTQIATWTVTEAAAVPPEAVATVNACLMEAIRPLPTEGKQFIFNAPDFQMGATDLIADHPEVAGDLEARLDACF
jgi:hypothetical protein